MINARIPRLEQFVDKMKQRKAKLSSRGAPNKAAVVTILRWIDKNFQSEGRLAHPDTGGWVPLAPSTIAAKERRWSRSEWAKAAKGKKINVAKLKERMAKRSAKNKILQDTGALKGRWHYTLTNDGARVWSGVEYGPYHDQQDKKSGSGKLPQRRILPTVPQIMPTLKKLYGYFVKTSLKD
jgi:phage gpG-like protein